METPSLVKSKNGWIALGLGWGVEAPTEEEAIDAFNRAQEKHKEIDQRESYWHERQLVNV